MRFKIIPSRYEWEEAEAPDGRVFTKFTEWKGEREYRSYLIDKRVVCDVLDRTGGAVCDWVATRLAKEKKIRDIYIVTSEDNTSVRTSQITDTEEIGRLWLEYEKDCSRRGSRVGFGI